MPNTVRQPPSPYALPFIVAITGHRDLHPDDVDWVSEQVFQAIALVAAALPHSPIHFLSALADGADQLFAEQVLRLKNQCRESAADGADRIHLIVPLPMPLEDYCSEQVGGECARRKDNVAFQAARAAFSARISRFTDAASSVFVIPELKLDETVAAQTTPENKPYAALTRYLGIHAHVVIAIWDGQTVPGEQFPRLPGGTLDLVQTLLTGLERFHHGRSTNRFAEPEKGNVIHVYARRTLASSAGLPSSDDKGMGFSLAVGAVEEAGGAAAVRHILEPETHWPGVRSPTLRQWLLSPMQACERFKDCRAWQQLISRTESALGRGLDPASQAALYRIRAAGENLDMLNLLHQRSLSARDVAAARCYTDSLHAARTGFLSSLPASAASAARTDTARDLTAAALEPLLHAFCVADVQAAGAKHVWRYRWLFIAWAAMLAASSSSLRLLSPSHGDLIETLAFAIGAIFAVAIYLWVALSNRRNAYLEYRALAEGLRFQMYWLAAGEHTLVTDHYVQKSRSELRWVRHAIDACMVIPAVPAVSGLLVARGWIAEQTSYLNGTANRRRHVQHTRSVAFGNNMLLTGLIFSIVGATLALIAGPAHTLLLTLLIIGMKLFTDIGTVWLSFNAKMGHSDTLKQADRLSSVYRRAEEALRRIENAALDSAEKERRARDLLFALGKEVLAENANWLATYDQRRVSWHGR